MEWNAVLDPTRNQVTDGAVYPAQGASIAGASTGGAVQRSVSGSQNDNTAMAMPAGSFVGGMITFLILTAIVMFIVHRWGGEDSDFGNIRASAYNVLVISLIAVVGVPVIKVGVTKLATMGVPLADHAATWALAA